MYRKNLAKCFNLDRVLRWHLVPVKKSQDVASHTFRVLCLASILQEQFGSNYTYTIQDIFDIMMHDVEELTTGDVPANRLKVNINDIDPVLHICDKLESLIWIKENAILSRDAEFLENKLKEYMYAFLSKVIINKSGTYKFKLTYIKEELDFFFETGLFCGQTLDWSLDSVESME